MERTKSLFFALHGSILPLPQPLQKTIQIGLSALLWATPISDCEKLALLYIYIAIYLIGLCAPAMVLILLGGN